MARATKPTAAEEAWPIAKVEWRKTGTLKQSPGNPKDHPDEQVDEILALIQEFGWTMPILVDEQDNVIAGHGRDLAAVKGKLPKEPVIVARGWSEAQKLAYRLADNYTPQKAPWKPEMVEADLATLGRMNYDVTAFGLANFEFPALEEIPEPAAPKPQRNKTTIFVSVLNKDHAKANKVIKAALDKANIGHNL